MAKILRMLHPLLQNLSVKAGLYAFGAVVASLIAVFFSAYVPDGLAELMGGDAVDRILTILASSMLAVVTFSLATLVTSYATTANIAPPRASALIIEDSKAKNALSTFLGAFIFSVVSLVALSTKYYGPKGRVILFFVTIGVLVGIILTMIKWIGQLSQYSLLTSLIERIEVKAKRSIQNNRNAFAWNQNMNDKSQASLPFVLRSDRSGFIRSIDLEEISKFAEKTKVHLHIEMPVGHFVMEGFVLVRLEKELEPDKIKDLLACIEIGADRDLEVDPRFAFIVLSEIGSKALSPGINDPGTAIQALSSMIKLISTTRTEQTKESIVECSTYLSSRKITANDIFDDAFRAIARDGKHLIEVLIFLHTGLKHFEKDPVFADAAKEILDYSYQLAEQGLSIKEDLIQLRNI